MALPLFDRGAHPSSSCSFWGRRGCSGSMRAHVQHLFCGSAGIEYNRSYYSHHYLQLRRVQRCKWTLTVHFLVAATSIDSRLQCPFTSSHNVRLLAVATSIYSWGGGGGYSMGPRTRTARLPPPPKGGLWPIVSCYTCRPQESMGADGARHSMGTKGTRRNLLSTPILKPNPDPNAHPNPQPSPNP